MPAGSSALPKTTSSRSRNALKPVVDFLNITPERALHAYHARVGNSLALAPDILFAAQRLGVTQLTLMAVSCAALARYELIPRRIEVMRQARKNDARALRELDSIEAILRLADRNAGQTSRVFKIEDPTSVPEAAFGAVGVLKGHFKGAPEAEGKLRARLGVGPKRVRTPEERATQEAVGFLAFSLCPQFRDRRANYEFVADLANAILTTYVTAHDVQHYRAAYARLQAL
jgi:hypothetical protein